jgi:hypothetical protein
MSAGKSVQGVLLYDANGDPLPTYTDGSDELLAIAAKLRNIAGTVVNPATEDTLTDVKSNQESTVDAGNSSTDQLGNGGTFVGTGIDCVGYSTVAITIHSDEDSATDGMKFQFSMDSTNWDDSYDWTLDASENSTRRFQFPVTAKYFRVNYTNGATTTTAFRVQTILHRQNILTSVHRLEDDASPDRSAQVMKAAIIAQRAGGPSADFIPVEANSAGHLQINVADELPAGDNNIGNVDVASSALPAGAATEASLLTRLTQTTGAAILTVLTAIRDSAGIKKIVDALPVGDNLIGRQKITDDGTQVATIIPSGGGVFRLQVESIIDQRSTELDWADWARQGIPNGTSYFIGIDLDNGGVSYKHTYAADQWIWLSNTSGFLTKEKNADEWEAVFGVILSITTTAATVAWLSSGLLYARDTGKFDSQILNDKFLSPMSLEVESGDLKLVAVSSIETGVTAINTLTTLKDVKDVSVTPAVGDVVVKIISYAGSSGTANLSYNFGYVVE